jgi:hypothetical protein
MNEETRKSIENLLATEENTLLLGAKIADQIIPFHTGTDVIFFDSARALIKGVMTVLILNRPNWTFKDVVNATRTKDQLRLTLLQSEHTKHLVDNYFTREEVINSIFSIIQESLEEDREPNNLN